LYFFSLTLGYVLRHIVDVFLLAYLLFVCVLLNSWTLKVSAIASQVFRSLFLLELYEFRLGEKLCRLCCINRKSNAEMSIRLLLLVNITVCYDYLSLPDLLGQHLYCNILLRVLGSGWLDALFIYRRMIMMVLCIIWHETG